MYLFFKAEVSRLVLIPIFTKFKIFQAKKVPYYGAKVYFVNCERILQQRRSLCSFQVVSFFLLFLQNFSIFINFSLDSRVIQTPNCAHIHCAPILFTALNPLIFKSVACLLLTIIFEVHQRPILTNLIYKETKF